MALLRAVKDGDQAEFFRLVNEGADIYAYDAAGHSLRWHARQGGNRAILDALDMLESVHGRKIEEEAPDVPAVRSVAEGFCSCPEEPEVRMSDCREACRKLTVKDDESYDLKKELLDLLETGDPDEVDENGRTPLMLAIRLKAWEVAELLVKAGADVNLKDDEGHSALMMATEAGQERMMQVLLAHGAVINARDDDGRSPLHAAMEVPDAAVALLLIRQGADVDAQDKEGKTPLFLAVRDGNWELAEMLLHEGADPGGADSSGNTVLMLAATDGSGEKFLRDILKRDDVPKLVRMQNNDGWTSLHAAANAGNEKAAALLVRGGAEVNSLPPENKKSSKNKRRTPLMLAAEGGYVAIVDYLIRNGARVNTAVDFNNAYTLARKKNRKEVVALLKKHKIHRLTNEGLASQMITFAAAWGVLKCGVSVAALLSVVLGVVCSIPLYVVLEKFRKED